MTTQISLTEKQLTVYNVLVDAVENYNVDGSMFHEVYLDNARAELPQFTNRQFAGILGTLAKKGLYIAHGPERVNGRLVTAWGRVRINRNIEGGELASTNVIGLQQPEIKWEDKGKKITGYRIFDSMDKQCSALTLTAERLWDACDRMNRESDNVSYAIGAVLLNGDVTFDFG